MATVKKERLLKSLAGKDVDRPPFICPGGMMNMVTSEMLEKTGCSWERAYRNPVELAELAVQVSKMSGIENLGVPFCMTVEAEAFGAEIEQGSLYTEPRVAAYPLTQINDWHNLSEFDFSNIRMRTVIRAVKHLAQINNDLPVIVSITGPISLATSLIEPMLFFRGMRDSASEIHSFLEFITSNLVKYADSIYEAGADILAIADPSASGEILGPTGFSNFALPYINKILQQSGNNYSSTLVHICGKLNSIFPQLNMLQTNAISIDSATSIKAIREGVPGKIIIGNVSTQLLQSGTPEQVKNSASQSLSLGASILAPACGLSMSTPLINLKAMAETAAGWPDTNPLKTMEP